MHGPSRRGTVHWLSHLGLETPAAVWQRTSEETRPMPIATPDKYAEMLDAAKSRSFAFPAINVSSSQTLNAALAGFAEAGSDGIIQVSTGGADYLSGPTIKNMVTGSVAFAAYAHEVAKHYPVNIALHTDHCPKDKLDGFVRPLLEISIDRVKNGEHPLFQSHMWDGSAVPLDENLQIAQELLKKAAEANIVLEVEIGVVGGEEDGVEGGGGEQLYSTTDDAIATVEALGAGENGRYMTALTFGTRMRPTPPPRRAPRLRSIDFATAFRQRSALLAWPCLREELEHRVRRMLVVVLAMSVQPGHEVRDHRGPRRSRLRKADERLHVRARDQSLVDVAGRAPRSRGKSWPRRYSTSRSPGTVADVDDVPRRCDLEVVRRDRTGRHGNVSNVRTAAQARTLASNVDPPPSSVPTRIRTSAILARRSRWPRIPGESRRSVGAGTSVAFVARSRHQHSRTPSPARLPEWRPVARSV